MRFRIGSVTKTFVATLVLQLAEESTLGLDQTVQHWLPGFIPGGPAITVRHLLAHTAGAVRLRLGARKGRWTPTELVSLAIAHPPERTPPGRSFAYSSTNYIVLGLIAERAGAAPLGRQLRERLFEPLVLRRTSFVPGVIRGRHVHGHLAPSRQGIVTGPPVDTSDEPAWWTWAAGGIVSTADDLQRFFAALLKGRMLGPAVLREMVKPMPAGRFRYGLGIAAVPTSCGPVWGHSGNVQGTIAVAWNTRDASRQLVLVVNTYPALS